MEPSELGVTFYRKQLSGNNMEFIKKERKEGRKERKKREKKRN